MTPESPEMPPTPLMPDEIKNGAVQNDNESSDVKEKEQPPSVEVIRSEKRSNESLGAKESKLGRRLLSIAKRYGVILPLLFYGGDKPAGSNLSEEQTKFIEHSIGYNIVELGARNGYTVSLLVPSDDGRYIINLGQVHAIENDKVDFESANEILESQKRIESLINDIKQVDPSSDIQVYAEAVVSNDYQKALEQHRVNLESIQPGTGCFIKLAALYRDNVAQIQKGHVRTFLRQMYEKRYSEIFHEVQQNPFSGWLDEITHANTISPEPFWEFSEENAYIHAGAINVLAFEGRINLRAAETIEQNDAAMLELERVNEICDDLEQGRMSTKEAKKNITAAQERVYTAVHTKRDSIAVERAAGDSLNKESGRILVYGNKHDFTRAVKNYNQKHGKGVGLISLRAQRRR